MAAQLGGWYATLPGVVGRWFTESLEEEWREVSNMNWIFDQPLVFAQIILMKKLGSRKSTETRNRIYRNIYLWEAGRNTGLAGDTEFERVA